MNNAASNEEGWDRRSEEGKFRIIWNFISLSRPFSSRGIEIKIVKTRNSSLDSIRNLVSSKGKREKETVPREKDRRIRKADNYARRAVDPTTWFRSSKQDLPRPSDLDKKTEAEALGGR